MVLAIVDSTIGKASQTAASEQKNATMSCTSVRAAMITARTAAARTGSGRRGFAYIFFTPPSLHPILARFPERVLCHRLRTSGGASTDNSG
ncbi:hypothetical protein ACIGW3_22995 [Streptomyces sp. NPDC053499]|uniref:hypothetical protein n=1 Tax=Streptomyces sp. NPDC053499 TaxID=3365707 RepID=UPI0037D7A47A